MTSNYDFLIVGGGAAGLMSATIVQNKGLRVGLLERNARVGKKLLATGNGRCNYTNIYTSLEDFFGENVSFASTALEAFPPQTILSYFRSLGIEPQIEANGKAFPSSEQASSFLDLFLLRRQWRHRYSYRHICEGHPQKRGDSSSLQMTAET